jgi:hypothetical protein
LEIIYHSLTVQHDHSNLRITKEDAERVTAATKKQRPLRCRKFRPFTSGREGDEIKMTSGCGASVIRNLCARENLIETTEPSVVGIPQEVPATAFLNLAEMVWLGLPPPGKSERSERVKPTI